VGFRRRRRYLHSFALHLSKKCEPDNDSIIIKNNNNEEEEDDGLFAQSVFGTKQYWDEMYRGRGDFCPDQYSWYYGWETIQPFWQTATKLLLVSDDNVSSCSDASMAISTTASKAHSTITTQRRVLLPGIGNDSDLVYKLYTSAGWTDITAIDYSSHAIERQLEILSYLLPSCYQNINFIHMDARYLEPTWTGSFDIILEKGTLDAIYLSSCGEVNENLKLAISELYRVLKPGGVLLSISGVVPEHVRQELFSNETTTDSCWEWIRDGGKDLQAGCFIFRKKLS
jgi:SAM-dependent methyltransferase